MTKNTEFDYERDFDNVLDSVNDLIEDVMVDIDNESLEYLKNTYGDNRIDEILDKKVDRELWDSMALIDKEDVQNLVHNYNKFAQLLNELLILDWNRDCLYDIVAVYSYLEEFEDNCDLAYMIL